MAELPKDDTFSMLGLFVSLAGTVSGEYNDVSMQVLTLLLNWKM